MRVETLDANCRERKRASSLTAGGVIIPADLERQVAAVPPSGRRCAASCRCCRERGVLPGSGAGPVEYGSPCPQDRPARRPRRRDQAAPARDRHRPRSRRPRSPAQVRAGRRHRRLPAGAVPPDPRPATPRRAEGDLPSGRGSTTPDARRPRSPTASSASGARKAVGAP